MVQADPASSAGSAHPLAHRRPLGDRGFALLALASGLLVLVILILIVVSTAQQSTSWFTTAGVKGIFTDRLGPGEQPVRRAGLRLRHGHHRGDRARHRRPGQHLAIALLLTEVVPRRFGPADRLRHRPARRRPVGGLGPVGVPHLRSLAAEHIYAPIASGLNGIPVLGNLFGPPGKNVPASGASFFTAGIILAFMITPDHHVAGAGGHRDRPGHRQGGRVRARRDPLGDDPRRRLAAQPGRRGRGGAARAGPGHGRDDRRALVIGSSAQITSHLFAPGYYMPAVIANQFGEAAGDDRAALIGLGVLLFVLTIIVNLVARGIVERSARKMRGA